MIKTLILFFLGLPIMLLAVLLGGFLVGFLVHFATEFYAAFFLLSFSVILEIQIYFLSCKLKNSNSFCIVASIINVIAWATPLIRSTFLWNNIRNIAVSSKKNDVPWGTIKNAISEVNMLLSSVIILYLIAIIVFAIIIYKKNKSIILNDK